MTPNQPMCAAFARLSPADPFQHVTLGGMPFLANKSLVEEFVRVSSEKHPEWEFEVREVEENAGA